MVVGIPDAVSMGGSVDQQPPTLEYGLDGIVGEDWAAQVLEALIASNEPSIAWLSASTWAIVTAQGAVSLEWQRHRLGGWVLARIPAGAADIGRPIRASIGYDSEHAPEFVIVPNGSVSDIADASLISWCSDRSQWSDPCHLLPDAAQCVVGFYNGWVHAALVPERTAAATQALTALASRWGLTLVPGPLSWAWMG